MAWPGASLVLPDGPTATKINLQIMHHSEAQIALSFGTDLTSVVKQICASAGSLCAMHMDRSKHTIKPNPKVVMHASHLGSLLWCPEQTFRCSYNSGV